MQTLEYHTVDKSTWGAGPWQNEPDKMQFSDPVTGLPCLIVRNPGGALCGYVGVPTDHPYYGKKWSDVGANVHGGITFAAMCQPGAEDHAICHIPGPDESDQVWWLGFDCAHHMDFCPGYAAQYGALGIKCFAKYDGEEYRDINYVKGQIYSLAQQLSDIEA